MKHGAYYVSGSLGTDEGTGLIVPGGQFARWQVNDERRSS